MDATRAAAESDIQALKASFENQKLEFKNKLESMEREIEETNRKYELMEKQMKTETKDRLEFENLLEQEIKQKQQLEVIFQKPVDYANVVCLHVVNFRSESGY